MKKHIRTYSRVLLAVALGLPVLAQGNSGFDVQFRAKFGYGLANNDHLPHRNLGLGLELGYTTAIGRFAVELGSQYKSGNQYSNYSTIWDDEEGGWNVDSWKSAPMEPWMKENFDDYFYRGGERKRNQLQGATLRLTYEYSLTNEMIARAGVQLFGASFRQEVLGTVVYTTPAFPQWSTANFITDSYAGAYTKAAGAAPSPFIGFGYRSGSSTIEFNLMALSYTSIDYAHVIGTGTRTDPVTAYNLGYNNSKDYFEEKSRMVPHLEIAYAFRF